MATKKKANTYKGKSLKPGGGGKFAKMVDALKYGAKKFAKMAATGRKRAAKKKK